MNKYFKIGYIGGFRRFGFIDKFFPEKCTKIDGIGHFAIEGVLGDLHDDEADRIILPE